MSTNQQKNKTSTNFNMYKTSVLFLFTLLAAGFKAQQFHCTSNGSKISVTCYDHEITDEKPLSEFCSDQSVHLLKLDGAGIKTLSQSVFSFVSDCYFDALIMFNGQVEKIEPGAFNNLPNMRSIFLSGNKIRTVAKDTFKQNGGENKNLKHLWLDNNHIETIEDGAFAGLNLDAIILSYNKLTEVDFAKLPNNILTLDLEHNNLKKMTGGANKYFVKNLDVTHTNVKPATLSFVDVDTLERISIGENHLTTTDLAPLAKYKNLIALNVSGNLLSDLQPSFFDNFPGIKVIDVSNTGLKDTNLTAIIANKPDLLEFHFHNNNIEKFDFKTVPSNVVISFHGNKFNFKCNELDKLIKELEAREVTVAPGSDSGDNVNGISCQK